MKWLHKHLWETLPEHLLWILIGGFVLALSGAAPEELIKEALNKLPDVSITTFPIDAVRLFLAFIGVLLIIGPLAFLRRKRRTTDIAVPTATPMANIALLKSGNGGSGVIRGSDGLIIGGRCGEIGGRRWWWRQNNR